MSGSPINWGPVPIGDKTLQHPLYQKWSVFTLGEVQAQLPLIKTDLKLVLMTNPTFGVVAYLATLIRLCALVAD